MLFLSALLSCALFLARCSAGNSPESCFTLKYSRMCLRQQYLYTVPSSLPAAASNVTCALACLSRGSLCQGFWLPNNTCEVFLFNQCSHMTNAANCTRYEWLHIRKQANLPSGHLCPTGYSHPYHGSTYKKIRVTSWTDGLNKCSSEAGLVKFADGMDKNEVAFMHWMRRNVEPTNSYYVGGYRQSQTWQWHACKATFLPDIWEPSQPNCANCTRAGIWWAHNSGLSDEAESGEIDYALCECVNPFV